MSAIPPSDRQRPQRGQAAAGTMPVLVLALLAARACAASGADPATSPASMAGLPRDEVVLESFEGSAPQVLRVPVPVELDSGQLMFFDSRRKPRSGRWCLAVSYRGGAPGRLRFPLALSGEETHLRIWVRCSAAEAATRIRLLVEDADGRRSSSAPLPLQAAAEWRPLEFALRAFSAESSRRGKADLGRVDWLLLECSGAPCTLDVDDVTAVGSEIEARRTRGLRRRDSELCFENASAGTEWWALLAAEYDPIQFMTESTSPNQGRRGMNDSWWTVERERVKKMGLQAVRMWFQIDWWEPLNDDGDPHHYEPDYSGFATQSPRMRSVYAFLDLCQEAGIEVCLNFGWKMDLPARYWLATSESRSRENPDIRDPAEHAESLVSLLRYLHDVKGYTVVTHITLGNELEYNYASLYPEMHARLVAEGLRDRYVLMGLENSTGLKFSTDLSNSNPGVLDVHTLHRNDVHSFRGLARQDRKSGRVHYSEFILGPARGVEIADAVVSFAEEGAYGCGGWRLADQHVVSPIEQSDGDNRFDHGLHQWGTWEWIPWMRRPRESYFAASLLLRYTRARSRVFSVSLPQAHDKLRGVCFEKNGEWTIVVLNQDAQARDVQVSCRETVPKTFRRHLFAPGRLPEGIFDTVVASDRNFSGSTIRDTLPAESFAVYTTLPDWPQIEVHPPVAVASPGDTLRFAARQLATKGRVQWSVDGGPVNGAVTSDGVYVAPSRSPRIDPVIVRATGDDARAVGLAVVSFSGEPEAMPSRPTVVTGRSTAPRGGSRIFDLGEIDCASVRKLDFRMINHGPRPAPYAIQLSEPWMQVSPDSGSVPPGTADSVTVTVRVDPRGLTTDRWYRGAITVRSPRGLGCDVLDVILRTKCPMSPDKKGSRLR